MYRLDTGQARTDLYGIGKGEAQVIDTTPYLERQKQDRAEAFSQKQAKAKEEQARQDDIMQNLSAMGKVAIMPKDRELIAGKSQAVRDYVVKNIDKLKSGDAQTMMQYQNLAGDLSTSAEQSKNFREAWEQRGLNLAKDPESYRPGVMDEHMNRAATSDAGNWNIDDSIYKKNINYNDRVSGKLSTDAQRMAQETPFKKTFTRKQADQLIADDLTDPALYDQAHYDFNNAKDKMGAKNPVEFYQKIHGGKLVVNDTKDAAEWRYGDKDKTKEGNVDLQRTDEGDMLSISQPKPYPMVINGKKQIVTMNRIDHNRKTGEITGIATIQPTQEERDIAKANGDEVVPQTVTLDYSQVRAIGKTLHGWDNLQKTFQNGEAPEGTNMAVNDTRKKEEPKAKEKLYVVGGKAYKESALKKQGYDISTLQEYK